jgi:glycopeptide antibiotics resistance protein
VLRWAPVVGYAAIIAMLTLAPRRGTSGSLDPTVVPLQSIADLLRHATHRALVTNLLGNLLLFAPLAVLLRLLAVASSNRVLAVVAGSSAVVELVQATGIPSGRQANVDDVILNVAGAAVALLLLHAARRRNALSGS